MTFSPKPPRTIADCEASIISDMRAGEDLINRLKRNGEWETGYASQKLVNPTGGPETHVGIITTPREWSAVKRLIAKQIVVIGRGSVEDKSVYLIAGPKFPKN
jgi:hypothetical protein